MMRNLFWFLMILALAAYSWMVWSWWDEGNRERATANASQCTEFMEYPRESIGKVPMSCVHKWVEVNVK